MEKLAKKRRCNWYKNQKNHGSKKRKFSLSPGQRGFLLFCNHNERAAIREAYILLNEYADKLYGSDHKIMELNTVKGDINRGDVVDVDEQIALETACLKEAASRNEDERRFQVVESGGQNVLFIRTTVNDPVHLAVTIMEDIKKSGTLRTRHLIRLIPIEKTCKVYETNITETLQELLKIKFGGKFERYPTYCVIFKARNNQNLYKDDAVRITNKIMGEICPNAAVDYKQPSFSVVFEVIKANCCVSVIPNYFALRKYNLFEIASANGEKKAIIADQGEVDDVLVEVASSKEEKKDIIADKGEVDDVLVEVANSNDEKKDIIADQVEVVDCVLGT